MARSACALLPKLAAANASPKPSENSAVSAIPELFLRPYLAAAAANSIVRAIQDVHGSGTDKAPDGLARDPDGKIVASGLAEIRRGQRRPEAVAVFSALCDPGAVLMPKLTDERSEGVAEQASRHAVENVDCACVGRAAYTLAGHADCKVVERIAIEIARGQSSPE